MTFRTSNNTKHILPNKTGTKDKTGQIWSIREEVNVCRLYQLLYRADRYFRQRYNDKYPMARLTRKNHLLRNTLLTIIVTNMI